MIKLFLILSIVTCSSFAKRESWYFQWGVTGASNATFSDEIETKRNTFKSVNDDKEFELSGAGEVGIYWPMMKSSLIGLSYTYGGVEYTTDNGSKLSSSYGSFGLSTQFYTGSEPGYGLFLRLDYGKNVHVYEEVWADDPTRDVLESSNSHYYLVGVGAGFPIDKKKNTRILVGANYSKAGEDIYEVEYVNIYFGFLF